MVYNDGPALNIPFRNSMKLDFTLGTLALLVLAPLLVWRIYARVKKLMVRQPSVMGRHWAGLMVFTAIVLGTLGEVARQQALLGYWAAGTLLGIGWGVFGMRKTRLELTDRGYFFTPYLPLGMVFALGFAARVLYLLFEAYANQGSGVPMQRLTDSPVTVFALTAMAGYFGTMSGGLLRWRLRHGD